MLTISKISSEGSSYYGKDNYYTKGEEEAGQWFGKGAKRLGLEGAVDNDQFDAMLKGKFNEVELGNSKEGKIDHHPGWDHTFSAPKSVSMLALVAGDERLIEAHDKAVNFALGYIEDNLAESRFRQGEAIESRKTGNIIAAKFRHDISRAKDPQLHTHAAILNATFGGNGILRSLDSPVFYEHKMLGGAMYQSMLAHLVQEIGYKIEIQDNGTFHIQGVDKELMAQASKRREEIVAMQKEQGTSGAVAAQHAALATRPKKEELTRQEKQDLWRYDFGDEAINKMMKLSEKISKRLPLTQEQVKKQELEAIKAVDSAVRHLSENESVFKTIDIAREAIVTSLGKCMPHQIKQAINAKIERAELLHAKTTEIKILNNKTKLVQKRAYTTPELIMQEKLTLKIMREERQKMVPIIGKNISLNREAVFTQGQAAAAREILTTKDRFINIQGFAGTGKTFMLEEVKEQAEKQNYKIIGMAPSAAAANVLAKETGIESKTVQKHLMDGLRDLNKPKQQDAGQTPKQKELWVIDESSFISTKQALNLAKLATKNNAQVVNIGDNKQLAGVEAGKPFAISQHKKYGLKTIKMDEIIRQSNLELKQAVYSATKGDVETSFAKINKNIIQVQDKDGNDEPILRREIIANTYLSMGSEERDRTLVISPANEDRFDVNNHIREGLKEEGSLGKKSIKTTNLVNKNLTNEAKTKSYNYHNDQVVRFNRGNKKLGIKKNTYLTVKSVNHDNNEMVLVDKNNGKVISWNPSKSASKSVEVYFENKRELNVGETLFWRRTASKNNNKRRTNEKIKILGINKLTKNVKYVDVETGETKSMNLNDFNNKHWEYAYCLTAHQAQGQTSDKVIINLESWRGKLSNQQAFYVEISRAKEEAIIFTDDKDKIQRQLTTKTGEKESALEQSIDKRTLHVDDIYRKQKGLKTSDEIAQEKNQYFRDKADKYIQKLSVEQKSDLEKEYRSQESKTILNMYDNAKSQKMKGNYQDQIRLYAQNQIRIAKESSIAKSQLSTSKSTIKQTQVLEKNNRPMEISR